MRQFVLAAAVFTLLVPIRAAAQVRELPKWDAGASFGLLWGSGWHPEQPDEYSDPHAAYHLELGRFWTTHLKSDFALVLTSRQESYESVPYFVPGVPAVYATTEHQRQLTAFSGAVTYQFFENAMMHPYVSAGAEAGTASDQRHRYAETGTFNRTTYTIPALDSEATNELGRPFVAVGTKSYFNERTYIRSEFATAFGASGFSHAILRIGFGFDF